MEIEDLGQRTRRAAALFGDLDVDLGVPGDPIDPAIRAMELRGVHLSHRTIRKLRAGRTAPFRTAYRLACVERLRANDASLKNQFLLRVIRKGLELRRPSPAPPRVYTLTGLTRAMEAALGLTHLDLSLIVRVMRADLAVWSTHTWDQELVTCLRSAAATFLRVHRDPDWRVLRGTNDYINVAWDKHTIHGFYFALYSLGGFSTRASWLPYELDVLLRFYEQQDELGNRLTPLDRQVLAGAVEHDPRARQVARMVRAAVGVDYESGCFSLHRRLLVTGSHEPIHVLRGSRPSPSLAAPSDAGEVLGIDEFHRSR